MDFHAAAETTSQPAAWSLECKPPLLPESSRGKDAHPISIGQSPLSAIA